MACGQPNDLLERFSSSLCRNLISSLPCKCVRYNQDPSVGGRGGGSRDQCLCD